MLSAAVSERVVTVRSNYCHNSTVEVEYRPHRAGELKLVLCSGAARNTIDGGKRPRYHRVKFIACLSFVGWCAVRRSLKHVALYNATKSTVNAPTVLYEIQNFKIQNCLVFQPCVGAVGTESVERC